MREPRASVSYAKPSVGGDLYYPLLSATVDAKKVVATLDSTVALPALTSVVTVFMLSNYGGGNGTVGYFTRYVSSVGGFVPSGSAAPSNLILGGVNDVHPYVYYYQVPWSSPAVIIKRTDIANQGITEVSSEYGTVSVYDNNFTAVDADTLYWANAQSSQRIFGDLPRTTGEEVTLTWS